MSRASLPATLWAALALLQGCAPSGSGGGPAPPPAQPVELRRGIGGTQTVVQRGLSLGGEVAAPLPRTWAALEAAYHDLGIDVTVRVPDEGRLGSVGLRLVRLDGHRASYYVDCGTDLSGPVADDARVLVTVTSGVQAQESGSLVATRLDAEARRRNADEGVRDCTSTGKLEALILEHVRTHLKG
jgi:hypothetical protein